jgi:hypothetical protein
MLIGLISDTHDNIPNILKSVKIFKEKKADLVLHLGDIIAPVTINFFTGLDIKFINGNCDGDINLIKERIKEINGEFLEQPAELILGNKKICLIHGKDIEKLTELINSNKYAYVFHGHSHKKRDEKISKTRVINPGGHYLDPNQLPHSIAILDLGNDKLQFIDV